MMLESVVASLLASGIRDASGWAITEAKDRLEATGEKELQQHSHLLYSTIREQFNEEIGPRETREFQYIRENIQELIPELEIDLEESDTEKDIVRKLANNIAESADYNLQNNKRLEIELEVALTRSFSRFINELDCQSIYDSQDYMDQRVVQSITDNLLTLLREFSPQKYYNIFQTSESEIGKISEILEIIGDVKYVQRPELESKPDCKKTLVTGYKGLGKSRSIIEITRRIWDEIDYILIPESALGRDTLVTIGNETFGGDVLLLWDDIHEPRESGNSRLFIQVVERLESLLENSGHELYVIAAARSEQQEALPGDIHDPEQFWSEFDVINLQRLNRSIARSILDESIDTYGINIDYQGQIEFLDNIMKKDPSPFYIVSVVISYRESEDLSSISFEDLPENTLSIWQSQFQSLRKEYPMERRILWAVKLLRQFDIPLYNSLIKGVYSEILGGDELKYEISLENIIDKQWLTSTSLDTLRRDQKTHRIHDVQIEAISELTNNKIVDLSVFLVDLDQEYKPKVDYDITAQLHANFANALGEMSDIGDEFFPEPLSHPSIDANDRNGNLIKQISDLHIELAGDVGSVRWYRKQIRKWYGGPIPKSVRHQCYF